ncbi:MAG: DUF454 family protein [Spirochaetaceae bacterium]|nr:DUF454 family protein [Spirochaetaceae bacterium]
MPKPSILNQVFVLLGILALALALVGLLLPLLPTTPLLLLATACFARGSSRLHGLLLRNKLFGAHLRAYKEEGAVTVRTKILSIIFLWTATGSSAFLATDDLRLRLLLLAVCVIVTTHLMRLKPLSRETLERMEAGKPRAD